MSNTCQVNSYGQCPVTVNCANIAWNRMSQARDEYLDATQQLVASTNESCGWTDIGSPEHRLLMRRYTETRDAHYMAGYLSDEACRSSVDWILANTRSSAHWHAPAHDDPGREVWHSCYAHNPLRTHDTPWHGRCVKFKLSLSKLCTKGEGR